MGDVTVNHVQHRDAIWVEVSLTRDERIVAVPASAPEDRNVEEVHATLRARSAEVRVD
jgi:hypothetical protein